jgi:hypothetical protein
MAGRGDGGEQAQAESVDSEEQGKDTEREGKASGPVVDAEEVQ